MWKESQGTIMVDQKQRDNMEYFSSLGNMVTNGASCTREIKSRIAMTKAAFYKKKSLVASRIDLNLRGKPVKSTSFAMGTWSFLGVKRPRR
jgi:hypothetical protein